MPTYIEWKPSLTVFVDEIDDQHKQLYIRMDAFLESVLRGDGQKEVGQTLKFLIDYCVVHFGTEELYMKRHNYPAYAAHKKAHEDLTASVLGMQREIEQGLTSQHILALVNQLGAWVTDHIEKMDKALGAYLGSALKMARSMRLPSPPVTSIPQSLAALSDEVAAGGENTCAHTNVCRIMFERFRDPESSSFWKTRYCMARGGMDCRRKQMMDDSEEPTHVPITMLPNGEHLRTLAH